MLEKLLKYYDFYMQYAGYNKGPYKQILAPDIFKANVAAKMKQGANINAAIDSVLYSTTCSMITPLRQPDNETAKKANRLLDEFVSAYKIVGHNDSNEQI